MKTYILRDPKTVEPQKPPRPLRAEPTRPVVAAVATRGPGLCLGLDVHNDSIAVSLAPKFHPDRSLKLREQVHQVMRFFHYAERSEESYWH